MGRYSELDYDAITRQNRRIVDATQDGGKIRSLYFGDVILLGDGHASAAVKRVTANRCTTAEITVTKGKGLDPGTLMVSGARVGSWYLEQEVRRFSKKKIVWV
ncbi:MAG TPA: hypothetical protein VKV26_11740 [Dehalococcoidia bacterium]|nr:hypothetical protein [Dehalococcoidia bacterium]